MHGRDKVFTREGAIGEAVNTGSRCPPHPNPSGRPWESTESMPDAEMEGHVLRKEKMLSLKAD